MAHPFISIILLVSCMKIDSYCDGVAQLATSSPQLPPKRCDSAAVSRNIRLEL